jgi:hypothetical protein
VGTEPVVAARCVDVGVAACGDVSGAAVVAGFTFDVDVAALAAPMSMLSLLSLLSVGWEVAEG